MRVESVLSGASALPARMRTPLFVVAVIGALAVAVLGILFAHQTTGTALDRAIREPLLGLHSPWRQIALVIDYLGEPVGATVMFAVLVVILVRGGHRRAALLVVAGPGLTVVVTTVLKPLVGRDINNGFLSYPSGHTATAAGVALVVMMTVLRDRRAAVTWTLVVTTLAGLAMAWAQVLLNAHYPTDTVGGYAAALAVVPPTAWLIDAISAWRSGSTRTDGPTRSPAPVPPPPDADRTV